MLMYTFGAVCSHGLMLSISIWWARCEGIEPENIDKLFYPQTFDNLRNMPVQWEAAVLKSTKVPFHSRWEEDTWLTEEHLKGDKRQLAGTAGEHKLRLLIKRKAAVFLSISVIPLFLRAWMFYSGET